MKEDVESTVSTTVVAISVEIIVVDGIDSVTVVGIPVEVESVVRVLAVGRRQATCPICSLMSVSGFPSPPVIHAC